MFGFGRRQPAGPSAAQWDADHLATKLQGRGAPLIVDVRSAYEFRAGHIPGAQNIPLGQIGQRAGALPEDRAVVCVCLSGHRSLHAAALLCRAGRQGVSLRGGMLRWRGPVERADTP